MKVGCSQSKSSVGSWPRRKRSRFVGKEVVGYSSAASSWPVGSERGSVSAVPA